MVVFQTQAGIAQSVEHFTRNEGVVSLSSSLPLTGSGYFEQGIRIFVLCGEFFCTFSVLALLKIYVIIMR